MNCNFKLVTKSVSFLRNLRFQRYQLAGTGIKPTKRNTDFH
jgi:hypothetical protein